MATNKRTRRITRDLQDFYQDAVEGISLSEYEDDLSSVTVNLLGPSETSFEGGTFKLEMLIPRDFPYRSPRMFLRTPVWHPNISKAGRVCMNVLSENWYSGITLIECAEAVQALLVLPNPSSPLNGAAANLLELNPLMYASNAVLWTRIHAGGTKFAGELEEKLSVLLGLGLLEKEAALKGAEYQWDINTLIEENNL